MYKDYEELDKPHEIMLNILKEIDRICKKNNIEYFIESGTLLGAVRHKGFIPWDDDVDIGMMRNDYNKFIELAKNELNKDYFLQTSFTDQEYDSFYMVPLKIRHKNSCLYEEVNEGKSKEYHQGIFVDIFPYDRKCKIKCINFFEKCISKFLITISKNTPSSNRYKTFIKRLIFSLFNKYNHLILKFLYKLVLINNKFPDEKIVYGFETIYNHMEYLYNDFFPLEYIEFEKKNFLSPNKKDKILKQLYGENYMDIPEIYDRKIHSSKIEIYN